MLLNNTNYTQKGDSRSSWLYGSNENSKLYIAGLDLLKPYPEIDFAVNNEVDIMFFVIEGQGSFFNQEETKIVSKGDIFHVPMKTKYRIIPLMDQQLKCWLITYPKFTMDQHTILP